MDRRTTLKWVLGASAVVPLMSRVPTAGAAVFEPPRAITASHGYGTDPDLMRTYHPGDLWPLTLTAQQRKTAAALCDVMIPEDLVSRSASQVGVVDFLDEWVSAPYPTQQADLPLIFEGLLWVDAAALRLFSKNFAALSPLEQRAICDPICSEDRAAPELTQPAKFFARYRDLTAGGFYTSPEGRKDLGYIGNVPLTAFEGPPAALLNKLGLL